MRLHPLVALIFIPAAASGAVFEDRLVQPPNIAAPDRGSLAGSLSGLAFDAAQLTRGAYSLAIPIALPRGRGEPLVELWPHYAPDGGLGEWGQGWSSNLELRRFRAVGEIDFASDDLVGPWGVMALGDDGAYYPTGKTKGVRVIADGTGLRAVTADGTVYEFHGADAVVTARGTYAWKLSVVRAVTGERTELSYLRNATGRPFLSQVAYGGRSGPRQYQVELIYEPLATPVRDYRSGEPSDLDRRVDEVRVKARTASGAYATAMTYVCSYEQSALGQAFYLAQLDAAHDSGAFDPPVRYRYDLGAPPASAAIPALDDYLASHGTGALLPSIATATDIDDDGLVDFEHHTDGTLFHQLPDGRFVAEPLPVALPGEVIDKKCRPDPNPANPPRRLARMSPTDDAPGVVVIGFDGAQTEVRVCDRAGHLRDLRTFPTQWHLDEHTRLVDLDRDGRPDLVRAAAGSYEVVSNQPTAWVPKGARPVTPAIANASVWAHDLNGDGVADLVGQFSTGIAIWYGRGNLSFDPAGVVPPFRLANGAGFASFAGRSLSFVDADQDGATDIMVSSGTSALLFANRGAEFRQVAIPLLPQGALYPLALDLSGSGEHELAIVAGGHASALRLTRPSTGLLLSVDDGRGTEISFGYARSAPEAGLAARLPVLASTTVRAAGTAAVTHSYAFSAAAVHSLGRFLVGFGQVVRRGPEGLETTTLHNDDDMAGLVERVHVIEAADPIERFTATSYEDVDFHGVRVMRPTAIEDRVAGPDGAFPVGTRTEFLAYARGVCATQTRKITPHGALETATTLASVAGIPDELHCLQAGEQLTGRHADPALDFTHAIAFTRNALGQLTESRAAAGAASVVLQQLHYDADARLREIVVPGRGTTTVAYDPATGQIARVVAPDGVVSETVERDPLTDLVRSQRIDRGGAAFASYFRYDELDRLARQWSDLGGSEAAPLRSYTYRDATAAGALGQIATRTRISAAAQRQQIDALTGGGDAAAVLRRVPAGWAVARLVDRDRSQRTARQYQRPVLGAAVPDLAMALPDLLAGAGEVALVEVGDGASSHVVVGPGVVHDRRVARTASATGVVSVIHDGPAGAGSERLEGRDDAGRLVWRVDEQGETTSLGYDALGRLVRIELPDGAVQREQFDGFGRTARIERTGIGARRFTYDVHSRVSRIDTVTPGNAVERSLVIARDAIGRPVRETHALANGQQRVFDYSYDGAVPGQPTRPGQLGQLTQLRSDLYDETTAYRADGRIESTTLRIAGWRSVRRDYTYFDDGAVASETWIVLDDAGAELQRMRRDDRYDAFGRISSVLLDGAPLARLAYDADGNLATADLANGERRTFHYDPVTRGLSGYAVTGAGRDDALGWTWSALGQIDSESIRVDGRTRTRRYSYDPRGFVAAGSDAIDAATYSYDPAGLPASTRDLAGNRSFVRTGNALDAGGHHYAFDALGRVIARDDLQLTYGPDGQLAVARRGGQAWSFASDPKGRRVVKLRNAVPLEAYVGGATLTADGLRIPYSVGGKVAGVLENGELRSLTADGRNTVVRDAGATLATPFGQRAGHAAGAAALDYAGEGFDADLGAVRMGVRDYDPYLGRFLTPDPLMLGSLDKCAASPVDCNLYAYARNNPLRFVDHEGTEPGAENLGALESVAPSELNQCMPEELMSPGSMPAPEPTLEPVDGFQGNPFALINDIQVDLHVFVGVSISQPGPGAAKPIGEVIGKVGGSTTHGAYAAGVLAGGVKAGVDNNHYEALTGVEASTATGVEPVVHTQIGVGTEGPAGGGVFAGTSATPHEQTGFIGIAGEVLGLHVFGGIGGNVWHEDPTSPSSHH